MVNNTAYGERLRQLEGAARCQSTTIERKREKMLIVLTFSSSCILYFLSTTQPLVEALAWKANGQLNVRQTISLATCGMLLDLKPFVFQPS